MSIFPWGWFQALIGRKPKVTQTWTLRRHRPGFAVDGPDDLVPQLDTFTSLETLKALPCVQAWMIDDTVVDRGGRRRIRVFHRLSYSPHGDEDLLMAEWDEGRHWWVIGYLPKDVAPAIGLPRIDMSKRD